MSWPRRALAPLVAGLALLAVAGVGASPAFAQDPSAAPTSSPLPSLPSLPGPAPACTPEVEPNDQPEQVPVMAGPICLTGTLPALRDQDLVLWEVAPADALSSWRITVVGIPTTFTSVHMFVVTSEPGVFPVIVNSLDRIDSDAYSDTPGVAADYALPAGRYLLGISRGDPAAGPPAPPGEYRVTFEREQLLPPHGDREPNDDATTATPVSDTIDLVGAVEDGPDLYRWTLDATAAASRHRVDLHVVPGDYLDIRLLDTTGTELARASTSREGQAHIHDLALPEGDYLIELSSGSGGAHGYRLTTLAMDDPGADAEPNDTLARALPMAFGEEVTGRLAGARDIDRYAVEIPRTLVASQVDVALRVGTAVDRRVCLLGPNGREVQCRQGRGDLVLSNLSLVGGRHVIVIDGTEDLADRYRLSVGDIGPRSAEREVEPNDSAETASPFDPGVTLQGRSANNDPDHHLVTTTGAPQLWRLEATGRAIRSLLWIEPDGEVQGTADVSTDGTHAALWDMYLIPGRHWIMVQTEGEDYALTMTPLGPVAEGQEREPNEDLDDAEPLDIGAVRTGRLPTQNDTDVVRFSLETREHVVIRIDPPADGGVRLQLTSGGTELLRVREPVPGQAFVYHTMLELGDYELTLQGAPVSTEPYRLVIDGADPWVVPVDLEPNDTPEGARDVPSTLAVSGTGFGAGQEDTDWFRIPSVPDAAEPLVIRSEGPVDALQLSDGTDVVHVDPDRDRTTWTSRALPATRGPLYLRVLAGADYVLRLSGGGLVPSPEQDHLPVRATLSAPTDRVSAYETFGQRLDAMACHRERFGRAARAEPPDPRQR